MGGTGGSDDPHKFGTFHMFLDSQPVIEFVVV